MLKLPKMTDYAFTLLSLMRDDGCVCSSSELANTSGLSETTVSRVLKILAKGGLVSSIRGIRGGYRLTRPRDVISVADVIVVMDGPIAVTPCTGNQPESCSLFSVCSMGGRWSKVNRALNELLSGITLADMMQDRQKGAV